MDILITDLSDETVEELTMQAEENHRSFAAELKAVLDARTEFRRCSRSFE
jgi:plasmid stability protein